MKKTFILLFTLLFATALTSAQSDGKDPKAKALLDKVYAKYKGYTSFTSSFTYKLKSPVAQMNEERTGTIRVKGDMYRINFSSGDLLINNSDKIWHYIKEDNEVNIYPSEEADEMMSISGMLEKYKTGYKYVMKADDKIEGVTYKIIDFEPILAPEERAQNQIFKIRVYISNNNEVARWKIFERNGNRYTTIISNFKANASVSDSTFVFEKAKYPGVEVVDMTE